MIIKNGTVIWMGTKLTSRNSPYRIELKEVQKYMYCNCGKSDYQPMCDNRSHRGSGTNPLGFAVERDGFYYLCGCKKSKSKPYCDGTHKIL